MRHLKIRISGKVQDVNFRRDSKILAAKLNLAGFARNEPDGSVYIEVEGENPALEEFLKWCEAGPRHAEVEKIETTPGELKNFSSFKIIW